MATSTDTPRVALVHDWLTGMRGGEYVLEQLALRFPRAPIHTLIHLPGTVSAALERRAIHTSFLQELPGLERHYRQLLPLFPLAMHTLDVSAYDLVVSTSHCVAKAVRVPDHAWHVCYCHTPMRYAWDQREVYFGEAAGIGGRLRASVLDRLRDWDATSNDAVDVFVANSTFVRDRVRSYYLRDADVVAPPVDTDFFHLPEHDEGAEVPYALSVATLAPYKRLDLAADACHRLGLELRVPGRAPSGDTAVRLAEKGVRFTGFVAREELRRLYQGATCFLQPGVEDFGITVVEALACGCPVVALGKGGVLDIVSDEEHGVLVGEPAAAEDFAAAVDRVRRMRFNKLNLRNRALEFSTPRFHQRMDSIFRDVPALRSTDS